ncbi:MAG TPA: carboxyltransferase domain-containing protein, partial [Chthoniobacterales bacterium]|nr:carboxyltransferase domain-containing protein [Chthoniobacterales bacterium]
MRIEPLGDSALLVRVVEEFEAEESLDAVLRATRQLEGAQVHGVIDLAPAYTTIGIFYDPATGTFDEIRASIERALERDLDSERSREATTIEVSVCYEGEFAPDLEEV